MQGEKNSRKAKQRNNYRKNDNRFKTLKLKKKKEKKGKLHRTAKSKIEAVVYNNNKKCDCIYTYT